MESFVLNTGVKKIAIYENDDDEKNGVEPRGVFKFNPQDVTEARKILELQSGYEQEKQEYIEKEKACETDLDKFKVLEEFANKYKGKLDYIYGDGTSMALFGNSLTYEMFGIFFEMITLKYQEFSDKRVNKTLEELQ